MFLGTSLVVSIRALAYGESVVAHLSRELGVVAIPIAIASFTIAAILVPLLRVYERQTPKTKEVVNLVVRSIFTLVQVFLIARVLIK